MDFSKFNLVYENGHARLMHPYWHIEFFAGIIFGAGIKMDQSKTTPKKSFERILLRQGKNDESVIWRQQLNYWVAIAKVRNSSAAEKRRLSDTFQRPVKTIAENNRSSSTES